MSSLNKQYLWLKDLASLTIQGVGGKAQSLGQLYNHLSTQGILVPNAYVITTQVYQQFIAYNALTDQIRAQLANIKIGDLVSLKRHGLIIRNLILNSEFPPAQSKVIIDYYAQLSAQYKNSYGQPQLNTDVAVRSSALSEDGIEHSFAGQYDTVLNVRGPIQLLASIKACYASLYNNRAIEYRQQLATTTTDEEPQIAVVIQKMVRSDLSASGVCFTCDVENNFGDVIIINASHGLCELVVQGNLITPDEFIINKRKLVEGYPSIIEKKMGHKVSKMVYSDNPQEKVTIQRVSKNLKHQFCLSDHDLIQLSKWALIIEDYYNSTLNPIERRYYDLEFAKDGLDQQIYIVQARPITTYERPLNYIEYQLIKDSSIEPLLRGIAIGDSIVTGTVRVILSLDDRGQGNESIHFKEGDILCTHYTSPDWEPLMRKAGAILTDCGGRTSHASIVCREWNKCCLVSLTNATEVLTNGQKVTVSCAEGETGYVYQGWLPFKQIKTDLSKLTKPKIPLMLNLASPDMAFKFHALPHAGIGLARVEFIINNYIKVHPLALLHHKTQTPSSANTEARGQNLSTQIKTLIRGYQNEREFFIHKFSEGIAKLATGVYPHPTIVRLSDFKSNEYANLLGGSLFEPKEENPMLGIRGCSRYYAPFFQPAFELECLAIKRAREVLGLNNIQIMLPFCRTVQECLKIIDLLATNGLDRKLDPSLKIGIMCEIPANVILADQFCPLVDFFSIGSNDLTQLTLGLDRDSELIAHLFDERNPAVMSLIKTAIQVCHRHQVKIGICGQAPSDYVDFARFLVEQKIDTISLTPDSFLKTFQKIANT